MVCPYLILSFLYLVPLYFPFYLNYFNINIITDVSWLPTQQLRKSFCQTLPSAYFIWNHKTWGEANSWAGTLVWLLVGSWQKVKCGRWVGWGCGALLWGSRRGQPPPLAVFISEKLSTLCDLSWIFEQLKRRRLIFYFPFLSLSSDTLLRGISKFVHVTCILNSFICLSGSCLTTLQHYKLYFIAYQQIDSQLHLVFRQWVLS